MRLITIVLRALRLIRWWPHGSAMHNMAAFWVRSKCDFRINWWIWIRFHPHVGLRDKLQQ